MNNLNGDAHLPNLPSGWAWSPIADITQSIEKVNSSQWPDQEFMYIDISSIDNSVYKITKAKKYKGSNAPSRARQLIKAHDVLFSTVRTYLRNIAQVPERYDGHIASTGFAVLRTEDGVLSNYLFYFCLSDDFMSSLDERQRGTSYPAVRDSDVREQLIPIAPLAEQKRIVAAIEERLSQIDDGVMFLQRSQQRLKRYREAVLQAALQGNLVPQNPADEPASALLQRILEQRRAKWEADQIAKMNAQGRMILDDGWKDSYQEPALPDTEGLSDLPEGWVWGTVDMTGYVQGGIQKQPSRMPKNNAYPYLRVANVMRGYLDLSEVYKIELFGNELERLRLESEDLLIVEGNGSRNEIGRSALWKGEITDCVHQNHIIRVRSIEVMPRFINYYINSPEGISKMVTLATTTSGLYTLSVSKIRTIVFPVPPLIEQQRIIAEVERRFSIIDSVEATIRVCLKRADQLRQIVLKQAFDGKLVTQNPADEAANILLERIGRERIKREEKLQAIRETEEKQPKPRGKTVKTKKSNQRQSLYDVLVEANTQLTPEQLFNRAGYVVETDLIADSVELFYDELRKEIPTRITIIRPNDSDVYLEAVLQ